VDHDHPHHHHGHPSPALLLLIPAALVAVRVAKHKRMTWDDIGDRRPGTGYGRHGRHRFSGRDGDPAAGASFRLPPKIEWMLDTWHTRAHAAQEPAEGQSA
jgi:hypothetical protein